METMTKKQETQDEIENAERVLKGWLRPGDSVYTVLNWVNKMGDNRAISLFIPVISIHTGKPEIVNITYYVAHLLGHNMNRNHGGLNVNGGGEDMGHRVVYDLSSELFREKVTKRAGYVLNHQWL